MVPQSYPPLPTGSTGAWIITSYLSLDDVNVHPTSSRRRQSPEMPSAGVNFKPTTDASPNSSPSDSLQYRIGNHTLSKPFVTINQLKGHLALLHAFLELRDTVNNIPEQVVRDEYDEVLPLPTQLRWSCFLQLCVERFAKWCSALNQDDAEGFTENALPPIDILMVWHAYMLNPGWYLEDCLRVMECRILKFVGTAFGEALNEFSRMLTSPASQSRQQWWSSRIPDMDFDIFAWMKTKPTKTFQCPTPHCRRDIEHPYVNKYTGEGSLQSSFAAYCEACDNVINKESLAIHKFSRAFASYESNEDLRQYFAGTIFTPDNTENLETAQLFKEIVKKHGVNDPAFRFDPSADEAYRMMVRVPIYPMADIKSKLAVAVRRMTDAGKKMILERLMRRVFTAYVDEHPFSIDLSAAVHRQFQFSEKMEKAGWTAPFAFGVPEEEKVLAHSLARYHAFMDLMTAKPGNFLVPTLDIDLGWHTHQLLGVKYGSDCLRYVARFIDHDDTVEESQLGQGFEDTCKAWESRFGMRYAYCGCSVPPATMTQRLSHSISTKVGNHQHNNNRLHKDNMKSSQPLPEEQSFAELTHPSYLTVDPSTQNRLRGKLPSSSSPDHKTLAKLAMQAESRGLQEDKTLSQALNHGEDSGLTTIRQKQIANSVKQRKHGHTPIHISAVALALSSGCGIDRSSIHKGYNDNWNCETEGKSKSATARRTAARKARRRANSVSSCSSRGGGGGGGCGGGCGGGGGGCGGGGGGGD